MHDAQLPAGHLPGTALGCSRRTLLTAITGGALATLAGCAPSPVIAHDSANKPSAPDASPSNRRDAAQAGIDLVLLLELLRGRAATWQLPDDLLVWLDGSQRMHDAHVTVLIQTDPLGGVNTDHSPIADLTAEDISLPGAAAEAWRLLELSETALATKCRQYCTESPPGPDALLWASLTVTASRSAAAANLLATAATRNQPLGRIPAAPITGSAVPFRVAVGSPVDAHQVLLSHVNALIYALQTGLGMYADNDPALASVKTRLTEAARSRDNVAQTIRGLAATPSPSPLSYQLPGAVEPMSEFTGTWRRMESRLLDGWGRVVAAEDEQRRDIALTQLIAQSELLDRLGTPLTHWPGWV